MFTTHRFFYSIGFLGAAALAVSAQLRGSDTTDLLPADYELQSAADKSAALWEDRILTSRYGALPALKLDPVVAVKTIGKAALRVSFDRVSDEMPEGRLKFIHSYGSVAKMKFVSNGRHPFTGVLKGADHVIARLSLAAPTTDEGDGYTPGMAVKFLIDGHPSVNIHVMNNLDGQGTDHNFFHYPFTNIIPPPESPKLKMLKVFFDRAVPESIHLGIDHLALRTQDGQEEADPFSPYMIQLVPTGEFSIASDSRDDLRMELARVPMGAVLYRVMAQKTQHSDSLIEVGHLVTESAFVASRYADERLFFKHQEFRRD